MTAAKSSLVWQAWLFRRQMKTWPQLRYRVRYRGSVADTYDLIRIAPADVDHLISPRFQQDVPPDANYVLGGDWDERTTDAELYFFNGFEDVVSERCLIPLDNYVFYRSVEEHLQEGVPWEETEFYGWVDSFEGFPDHILYGRADTREWRFAQIDRLARSMLENGYKRQRACSDPGYVQSGEERLGTTVTKSAIADDVPPEFHEVMINIGRDGRLIFEEGRHRFVVARALGIDAIPVRVFVRHERWQQTRSEVANAASLSEISRSTRRRLDHPDLRVVSPLDRRDTSS